MSRTTVFACIALVCAVATVPGRAWAQAAETPAETSADALAETSADAPAEASADAPAEASADAPAEASADQASGGGGEATSEDSTADANSDGDSESEKNKESSYDGERGTWRWGIQVGMLRIGAVRSPSEPSSFRNIRSQVSTFDGAFGFQASYSPEDRPFRFKNKGTAFQFISLSAMLLVDVNTPTDQSRVSLGVGLSFFDRLITIGLAFDLYRGVPVLSVGGSAGGDTASTGLMGWALSPEGEITSENVSMLISIDLVSAVRSLGNITGVGTN